MVIVNWFLFSTFLTLIDVLFYTSFCQAKYKDKYYITRIALMTICNIASIIYFENHPTEQYFCTVICFSIINLVFTKNIKSIGYMLLFMLLSNFMLEIPIRYFLVGNQAFFLVNVIKILFIYQFFKQGILMSFKASGLVGKVILLISILLIFFSAYMLKGVF